MSSTINDLKTPSSDNRLVLYKDMTDDSVHTVDLYNTVKPYEGKNKFLLLSLSATGHSIGTGSTMIDVDTFITKYELHSVGVYCFALTGTSTNSGTQINFAYNGNIRFSSGYTLSIYLI